MDPLLDLPKNTEVGSVEPRVFAGGFREGDPAVPLRFNDLHYVQRGGECSINGVVTNDFSRRRSEIELDGLAYSQGTPVAGSFTYVDNLFPGADNAFEISLDQCPAEPIDEVKVYPLLTPSLLFAP